ncbi:MAG: CPBP family intramembrane metalloprotease [Clostridiales bacterium]|nr:CPBP family intramembrane metalloprotease [Clostridiales bacterium]
MQEPSPRKNLSAGSVLSDYILPFILPSSIPNLGVVLLGAFGLSYLLQMVWIRIPQEKLFFSKTSLIGYTLITLFRLLALLLVYVLVTEHYKVKEHHTWGRNPGLGGFFISFLVGVPAMLLSASVHNFFIYFELRMENPIPRQFYYYVTSEESIYGVLLLLVIGILLPILIEELFFRGLLYAVLPDRWWIRIPLPALLSTLFAINRLEFPALLVIGLCCSCVRYLTDSTLCSCLTRIGLFCARTLLSRIITIQDPDAVQNAMDYTRTTLYASLIALVLGVVMLIVLIKQMHILHYLQKNEDLKCESEEGKALKIPLREQFHLDLFFGIAFLILCWIMS